MTRRIALVGNPNVGKSTIFNALTGLHQKTANWAGVTVSGAQGTFFVDGISFSVTDLPGIYSLRVRSAEEAVTRDFLLREPCDYVLVICDATCLERGLYLLKQVAALLTGRMIRAGQEDTAFQTEQEGADIPLAPAEPAVQDVPLTLAESAAQDIPPAPTESAAPPVPRLLLCVNLCDEAERKGIRIDFSALEHSLGIPVVPAKAREHQGLNRLLQILSCLEQTDADKGDGSTNSRRENGSEPEKEFLRLPRPFSPEALAHQTVQYTKNNYRKQEEILDRFLTGPVTGNLTILLLLMAVFWLTITGANYPSAILHDWLFSLEDVLWQAADALSAPPWLADALILGVYRVTAWIVSVMLPPMAIFFPLFTLLEDLGYLPRAAFCMDSAFQKCRACGKQCLTMAMGLGCNAAGVTGCRIIDSPRERLIAILTNSLVPCNGRFPLLITMITLFMAGQAKSAAGWKNTILSALLLTALILLSFGISLGASWLLSHTLLRGFPSFFTLELPPYRKPQIGRILIRSILDRTLFVLGRAITAAAPAGLLIWLLANLTLGGDSLLSILSGVLDPLGKLMGLDGVILMAFLLGFPANEIVLPIILMAYLQTGSLTSLEDSTSLYEILSAHGWTIKTIACMAAFTLFHWPCATTCMTIKKETGSLKWTLVSILLPAVTGFILCILLSGCWELLFPVSGN